MGLKKNDPKLVRVSVLYILFLLFMMVSNTIKNDFLTFIVVPTFMLVNIIYIIYYIKNKLKKREEENKSN